MIAIDEVGYRDVAPDPSIADAVGRHHSFATAIADLVDNSIDADATYVLIRFLTRGGYVTGLRVIDDGRGMTAAALDRAMTFGRRREYEATALGHFGLGLKAASLSQAHRLDVYSLAHGATTPAGRRITSAQATRVAELDQAQVAAALTEPAARIPALHGRTHANGTIVEWGAVHTVLSSSSIDERKAWLEDTIESLRAHLGLVLHRILARGSVTLAIDEFDTEFEMSGATRKIAPIDPFALGSGAPLPAVELRGSCRDVPFGMRAHIWTAQHEGSPHFRLYGLPGSRSQGFFVYRHDRLLQPGGWNGVVHGGRSLEFARVVLDLIPELTRHVSINPEKSGVAFDASLRAAIEGAVSDAGVTFRSFLDKAEAASTLSRKRTRRPVTLTEVRRGLSPDLRATIGETITYAEQGPIEIRWKAMRGGTFVDIDLERRTLWLNAMHRRALGANAGEVDDLPLIKMLLLLLYSRFFEGYVLGAREKDELQAWEELIGAALDEELERRSHGEEPRHER